MESDLRSEKCKLSDENASKDEKITFEEEGINEKRNCILDCIAKSDGFFKNQQRGEADLTFDDKWKIANDLLDKNVSLFLRRYWKFINDKDISYFEPYKTDYEVNFYMTEIEKMHKSKNTKVKNRRYEALQRLIQQGSYFSDSSMRHRNPVLYERMVGRFLTEKERKAAENKEKNEMKFSTLLLEHLDRDEKQSVRRREQELEDEGWEEENYEEMDDDDDDDLVIPNDTENEKQLFRKEFISMMYEQFLSGKDNDFNYGDVDNNIEYDSIKILDMDEEEKYFDSEEPVYIS